MSRFSNPPTSFLVLDVEKLSSLEEHDRYLAAERTTREEVNTLTADFTTAKKVRPELAKPRWPFGEIKVVSAMHLIIDDEQHLQVKEFKTYAQEAGSGEACLLKFLFAMITMLPANTAIVTWSGDILDINLLVMRAARHALRLPPGWDFLLDTRSAPQRYLDLLTMFTRGHRVSMVHMAEVAAAFDLPVKFIAPPKDIARKLVNNDMAGAKAVCEADVITTTLILAHWLALDGRIENLHADQRAIVQHVLENRNYRPYVPVLETFSEKLYVRMVSEARATLPESWSEAA